MVLYKRIGICNIAVIDQLMIWEIDSVRSQKMEYECVGYTTAITAYEINVIERYDIFVEIEDEGNATGDGK